MTTKIHPQAGTGVSGLTVPFFIGFLLEKYGYRTALRVWAVSLLLISSPVLYFLKRRLPITAVSQSPRYGLGFLRTASFWLPLIGLSIESLGFFIPSIYLPEFARSLGLSRPVGTLLVALVNGAGVFSTIVMGMLVDRFHVTTVIMLSTVGAVVSVLLFWGFSTALPLLCIFAILYGFFAGGFVSTIAGVIKIIKQHDQTADIGMLLGLMSAGRGIGAVLSGPMSEALLKDRQRQDHANFGYGSDYGSLIVFTGVTAALGGISFIGKRVGWM
jgi:MFS family permease